MKQKPIRIQSQAQQESNQAFDWYLRRSSEAADAFLSQVGASLAQIASHPQLYPIYTKNTRRRVLEGFPSRPGRALGEWPRASATKSPRAP